MRELCEHPKAIAAATIILYMKLLLAALINPVLLDNYQSAVE
jgi:hypothetical protein